METVTLDINKYDVDQQTGFMLQDPLERLPPYFDLWNKIASNVPQLVEERKLRDEVHKLPQLDADILVGHQQLRLAHLQLAMIASGYVWQDGDKGVVQVLPKCVAVPYSDVSNKLGIPPALTHASLVLANWSKVDPNGSYDPNNLKCFYHLPGGVGAEWFVTVTVHVELTFAQCLQPLLSILEELRSVTEKSSGDLGKSDHIIEENLDNMEIGIKAMQNALSRMHDKLTAKTFFNVLRPFLGGWGGEGNSLPDGLIYEGVSDLPRKLNGGSAAQSSTMQVLDAFFGVQHSEEKRTFLVHMRDFMLQKHRQLIEDLEQWPHKLRDFVLSSKSQSLRESYNKCISALVELRTYHIQIVTKYIVVASKEMNEGNYESLDDKGTGGTSLIPFLQVIRGDTEKKLVLGQTNLHRETTYRKHKSSVVEIAAPSYSLLFTAVASTLVVGLFMRSLQ